MIPIVTIENDIIPSLMLPNFIQSSVSKLIAELSGPDYTPLIIIILVLTFTVFALYNFNKDFDAMVEIAVRRRNLRNAIKQD